MYYAVLLLVYLTIDYREKLIILEFDFFLIINLFKEWIGFLAVFKLRLYILIN